jgi:hypothetical protein
MKGLRRSNDRELKRIREEILEMLNVQANQTFLV